MLFMTAVMEIGWLDRKPIRYYVSESKDIVRNLNEITGKITRSGFKIADKFSITER